MFVELLSLQRQFPGEPRSVEERDCAEYCDGTDSSRDAFNLAKPLLEKALRTSFVGETVKHFGAGVTP